MSEPTLFTLDGPNGPLEGFVDLPEEPGERPAVVLCHGFKGFMDWGFFPPLAALLAARGFVVVRVNLSGSGMRPGGNLVDDPEAFRRNTHSREVADLLATLEATGREIAPGRVDRGRLGLLGHSRGGAAAILIAGRPEWRDRLRALVTWASISTFDRFTPEQKEAWRRDGVLPAVNARTGQELFQGLGLLEDLEAHAAELDVEAAAGRGRAPWLIVHGEEDDGVPVAEADRLYARAQEAGRKAELLRIPGANHTFGSRHPFAGPTPHLIQAMNATQGWLRRYLS